MKPKRRQYTDAEIKKLIRLYPNNYTKTIAKKLGRTPSSIYMQAYKLGLRKSPEFIEAENQKQGKKLIKAGMASRFISGQEPPNKGKKTPPHIYGRISKTMFKKGCIPHNAYPADISKDIERKDSSGKVYLYVKLPGERKIKPKHIWLWETHNGNIPKGYKVVFKDRNSLNCTLENLECITNAELMNRNSLHRLPEEVKTTIRLITKLKKKIYAKEQN